MCATCPAHLILLDLITLTIRWRIQIRECIQKFQDWVDNEIYAYNNKHLLRSNKEGYGGKTH
jgi:hypothetical protein